MGSEATRYVGNTTDMLVNGTGNDDTGNNDTIPMCSAVGECLHLFLTPVIVACGVMGNFISFKIFACTNFRRHSSSTFLAALSMTDTGFLLALFMTWIGGSVGVDISSSLVYCHIVVYVTYVCSCLSVWYVVLIMAVRYLVICHPQHVRVWCSRKKCALSIIIMTIFAMFFYSHTFFTSGIRNRECSIAEEHIRFVVIFTYVDSVVTFLFPILTVFILDVIVIKSIRRFRKRQYQNSGGSNCEQTLSSAEVRVTTMLAILATVLLVTNLPSHGIRLYIMIKGYNEVIAQVQIVSNLLYFCNFAVTFPLYCSMSARFWRCTCMKTGCCSGQQIRGPALDVRRRRGSNTRKGTYIHHFIIRYRQNAP